MRTDVAYMDVAYIWTVIFGQFGPISKILIIFDIFDIFRNFQLFWTVVLDLIFVKIFVKFLQNLLKPKPLFIFDRFLTVGIPVRSIFAKDKTPKIFGRRSVLVSIVS